jgi:hypothetical protein
MIEVIYVTYAFLDQITVTTFQIGSDCNFSDWIELCLFGFGLDLIQIQNADKISDANRPI